MNKIELEKVKALLLDFDGTLVNTEAAFCNCFIDFFKKEYGIDITFDEYKKYELEHNAMLIKTKKKEYQNITISDNDIMTIIYNNYMGFFKKTIVEDEALDNFNLLKKIKDQNITLALVTTCRRMYLNELIKTNNLDGLFDYIVARDDVKSEELKPNPKAYQMALDTLNLSPEDCLAIEDSKRGIDAAVILKIPTIKVENFTAIKYHDDRVVEEESTNKVLRKILKVKSK
ncbi:MAG: HAD family phosphatase [Bacilli bacterium]|nr:HAD family phosphatase [Bacilli bacterium]